MKMKKVLIFAYSLVGFMALICLTLIYLLTKPKPSQPQNPNTGEYIVYPSDSTMKWNIRFSDGSVQTEITPGQLGYFFEQGNVPEDTTWHIHPQSEYQLTIVDDYIIVMDFDREVAKVKLSKLGELENILIKDNE